MSTSRRKHKSKKSLLDVEVSESTIAIPKKKHDVDNVFRRPG